MDCWEPLISELRQKNALQNGRDLYREQLGRMYACREKQDTMYLKMALTAVGLVAVMLFIMAFVLTMGVTP